MNSMKKSSMNFCFSWNWKKKWIVFFPNRNAYFFFFKVKIEFYSVLSITAETFVTVGCFLFSKHKYIFTLIFFCCFHWFFSFHIFFGFIIICVFINFSYSFPCNFVSLYFTTTTTTKFDQKKKNYSLVL